MENHLRLVTDAENTGQTDSSIFADMEVPQQTAPQAVETPVIADIEEDPHAELRQRVAEARAAMFRVRFNPETGEGAAERRAFGEAMEALHSAQYGEPEGAPVISLRRPT